MRYRATTRRGMTLVEILVVMAIIIVLGALIITALWKLYKAVKTMFTMGDSGAAIALVMPTDACAARSV